MANFFAQPDALACGCTAEELRALGVDEALVAHRTFPGDRPSNVFLLPRLTARAVGQLLALYEHRTAVQGFVCGVNSFDQWGVELGKTLAGDVRDQMRDARARNAPPSCALPSTSRMLRKYLELADGDERARD
jgi:glucose-6-phosphate isomerase